LPCSVMDDTWQIFECLPCYLIECTRQRSSDMAPSVNSGFRQNNFCRVPGWKAHGKGFAVFHLERHTAKVLCRAVFRRVDFAVFRRAFAVWFALPRFPIVMYIQLTQWMDLPWRDIASNVHTMRFDVSNEWRSKVHSAL
jgi:hypothetical protein